jgi:putative ABC transport system permease protein
LLTGAGLMLRTLWTLQSVDLGFRSEGVLTARIALPAARYARPEQVVAYYQELLPRLRAVPGVQQAGVIRALPLGATIGDWGLRVEGYTPPPGLNPKGDWQVASDGALEALGEKLIRGRLFTAADNATAQPVALINETMARAYWAGRDPVGKQFRMGGNPNTVPITIVGIVGDVRHNGVSVAVKEKFYRPYSQFHQTTGNALNSATIVARTSGDPAALAGALRQAVRGLDPRVAISAVRPMEEVVATAMTSPRLTSSVLTAFGAIAIGLAALGIYGLLAFFVAQRTREIGIRVAMGAGAQQVLRLVFGHGLTLSGAGLIAGLGIAALSTRLLATQLHGISGLDLRTYLSVAAILLVVALGATVIPAWRALRIDPLRALRDQR